MDVELDGVTVTIGGWRACDDVTLRVATGTVTAINGPNGAGKSSLLRCLYRALRPVAGTVHVGGDDVWTLPGPKAGRRTAAVVQEPPSGLDFTVREAVALGRIPHRALWRRLTAEDHDTVDLALGRVGLTGLAEREMGTLSGGERQRALIARALAQQASVLVLDEPTNHLDVRHQLETLALVRTLGVTVVAALHDLALAAHHADRVAVLHHGRLVATGPPDTTLTPALIAEVFGVDAEVATTPDGRHTLLLALPPSAVTAAPSPGNRRTAAANGTSDGRPHLQERRRAGPGARPASARTESQ